MYLDFSFMEGHVHNCSYMFDLVTLTASVWTKTTVIEITANARKV